ncbi:MAG TPA: 3'(2'),5'-bisphosphate nucleotidase CysQ [Beijerinckiaceae bacterium]|jgi:3'(2'),5'-bisphosphate nucleotidase
MDTAAHQDAEPPPARGPQLQEKELLTKLASLALKAGKSVMRVFEAGPRPRYKADASPVCEADEAAEEVIIAGLAARYPDIPIVAEEAAARGAAPVCGGVFFLVDPLDGTREFVQLNGDFTVNIALIVAGEPRAGVVYAPMTRRLWVGSTLTAGKPIAATGEAAPGGRAPAFASLRPVRARPAPAAGLTALVSRSHGEARAAAFLDALPVVERRPMGSSIKFCLIAEGAGDVYPRFGPTMEWDTAAGDAVLRAAGGRVVDETGAPLRYGKAGQAYHNPPFIAWGAPPA